MSILKGRKDCGKKRKTMRERTKEFEKREKIVEFPTGQNDSFKVNI